MSIAEQIRERGIEELLHFTTNRGLVGSLASNAVLSRPLLREEDYLQHVLHMNSQTRPEESSYFDKTEDWVRFVNLSISEINKRFLDVSKRWHTDEDVWWVILAFDPIIMTHENVTFSTTNNGYVDTLREKGEAGFSNIFAPTILRKANSYNGRWQVARADRASHLPTCEQAEVLYPEKLELRHLTKIYVEESKNFDQAKGWASEFGYAKLDVEINPNKFLGQPN